MFAPSHIELSKSAFEQNIKFLNNYIGKEVTFCSVIKGNAYGHGIEQFVPMAEDCGISHFAVFSADEARLACKHKQKPESHVMIMGMISNGELQWAVEENVSFYIFELDRLKHAIREAEKVGKAARIHLHLETGMNRLGLSQADLEQAVSMIKEHRQWLAVEGICTHYAGAESVSNHVRVTRQIKNFKAACSYLQSEGINARWKHSACSAATLNYPETMMDMVRIGIAQYGYWPNRETYMKFLKNHANPDMIHEDPLRRVLSWKSQIMSLKSVDAGEFIGYGTTYQTSRKEQIASVPIGYSHGFKRQLTNIGIVLVKGSRAQVAGLVNMNLLTIDVTDIKGVSKGDEVVIIGHQGNQEMSVASFSEMTNYLNYEVLVQIPSRLPRKVVK